MALVPPGIDSFRDSESWDDDKSCCNLSAAFVLLIKPCALALTHSTQLIAGFLKAVAANDPVVALSPYCPLNYTLWGSGHGHGEGWLSYPVLAQSKLSPVSFLWFLLSRHCPWILCLHLAEGWFCPLLLRASLVPSCTLLNGCRRHKITAFTNVYYWF